jgi:hypothetical protein
MAKPRLTPPKRQKGKVPLLVGQRVRYRADGKTASESACWCEVISTGHEAEIRAPTGFITAITVRAWALGLWEIERAQDGQSSNDASA